MRILKIAFLLFILSLSDTRNIQRNGNLIKRSSKQLIKQNAPDSKSICEDAIRTGIYNIPNPVDCTKFYVCNLGKAVSFNCPAGLHFNIKIHACDWPNTANCKTVTDRSNLEQSSEEYADSKENLETDIELITTYPDRQTTPSESHLAQINFPLTKNNTFIPSLDARRGEIPTMNSLLTSTESTTPELSTIESSATAIPNEPTTDKSHVSSSTDLTEESSLTESVSYESITGPSETNVDSTNSLDSITKTNFEDNLEDTSKLPSISTDKISITEQSIDHTTQVSISADPYNNATQLPSSNADIEGLLQTSSQASITNNPVASIDSLTDSINKNLTNESIIGNDTITESQINIDSTTQKTISVETTTSDISERSIVSEPSDLNIPEEFPNPSVSSTDTNLIKELNENNSTTELLQSTVDSIQITITESINQASISTEPNFNSTQLPPRHIDEANLPQISSLSPISNSTTQSLTNCDFTTQKSISTESTVFDISKQSSNSPTAALTTDLPATSQESINNAEVASGIPKEFAISLTTEVFIEPTTSNISEKYTDSPTDSTDKNSTNELNNNELTTKPSQALELIISDIPKKSINLPDISINKNLTAEISGEELIIQVPSTNDESLIQSAIVNNTNKLEKPEEFSTQTIADLITEESNINTERTSDIPDIGISIVNNTEKNSTAELSDGELDMQLPQKNDSTKDLIINKSTDSGIPKQSSNPPAGSKDEITELNNVSTTELPLESSYHPTKNSNTTSPISMGISDEFSTKSNIPNDLNASSTEFPISTPKIINQEILISDSSSTEKSMPNIVTNLPTYSIAIFEILQSNDKNRQEKLVSDIETLIQSISKKNLFSRILNKLNFKKTQNKDLMYMILQAIENEPERKSEILYELRGFLQILKLNISKWDDINN